MLTNWIIFGVSALAILKVAKIVNTILLCKRVEKANYTEEDLNRDIMERNNRMLEEAKKKGLAA